MIFYIMGKSASGKDKLYKGLMQAFAQDPSIGLEPVILYTTRPIRTGEKEGRQYHFTDGPGLDAFRKEGKVIEERTYETIAGPWTYATVDKGLDPRKMNYLAIGTLVSYRKVRDYFGPDLVVPLYIEVSDENLLIRAMKREGKQETPSYREMCRRFLADAEDFSEEKIREAGIEKRYDNNGPLEDCLNALRETVEADAYKIPEGTE